MATAVLGKVSITPKGSYVSGASYARLDAVYDTASNASYLSLKNSNTAALANDGMNWMYLCRGIGITTDNNFTNAYKAMVDSAAPQTRTIAGLDLTKDRTLAELIAAGLCAAPTSGTWTPTLFGKTTAGSPTYSAQSGFYYKVGKLVVVSFCVVLSAKGGMAGELHIGGLPFACGPSDGNIGFNAISNVSCNSGYVPVSVDVLSNSSEGSLKLASASGIYSADASIATDTFAIWSAAGLYVTV